MYRIAVLALFAPLAFAQDTAGMFNRAPKRIDDALRARIDEFYAAHVKGEFRKAESLVAEDTKEFFYDHDKPRYLSFEISRIEYSDGYTRAKATILAEQTVMFPGFAGKPMKIPTPSYWKIEKGKWCWYIDQTKLNETPFGTMKAGPAGAADSSPAAIMAALPSNSDEVMNLVRADKSDLILKPGESGNVVIANAMKGPVTLSIEGKLEGIAAALDRESVPGGEKATLTVKAAEGAKSGKITVLVKPIGNPIAIRVTVK